MGYYVRAFCKSNSIPSFTELQNVMSGINSRYKLEGEHDDKKINWTNLEFHYKEDKLPILVDLNWTDEEGSLGKEEVEEVLETIGRPGLSFKKRKVISHLKRTKYIVCNQLPTSNIDDDGYNANAAFLNFFITNFDGMFHADGEGFYHTNKIILKE